MPVYLCARGVACAGPCGGSLRRTVRALSRQPSAAVRVAEALAVLFADLRRQTAKCLNTMLTLHMTLQEAEWGSVCSLYQHLWIQLKVWTWLLKSLLLFTLTEKNRTQCRVTTYFFLEKAVENEDKHSLEGVEYGEEVRHNNRGLADEEEPKRPGETEQTQQSKSTHDPGSEGRQMRHRTNPAWGRFCDRTVIGILITRFHYEICRKG